MSRRLKISCAHDPALTVSRGAVGKEKLVHLVSVNKPLKYRWGKSSIAYIGTTQAGIRRLASSAASNAKWLFEEHGINEIKIYPVFCQPRQRVKTWQKLESGLLLAFKHKYGQIPWGNTVGKNRKWRDELKYFTESALDAVMEEFEP